MAGSTGVLPSPKGYLQRLRAICDRHGILLIFDEVITGFGRLGDVFAAERYGVTPDLLCFAKGVKSGAVPMGGVIARENVYDAFMHGPEHVIELFHGYTYSAHPLACAAGIAALDLYRDEDMFGRAKRLEPLYAEAAMTLKGLPGVLDVRAVGIAAGIDLAPRAGAPGERGYEAMERAFHDEDLVIRIAGDTLAIAPPLIVSEAQIGEIFEKVAASFARLCRKLQRITVLAVLRRLWTLIWAGGESLHPAAGPKEVPSTSRRFGIFQRGRSRAIDGADRRHFHRLMHGAHRRFARRGAAFPLRCLDHRLGPGGAWRPVRALDLQRRLRPQARPRRGQRQVSNIARGSGDLARQMAEFGRRLGAVEDQVETAIGRAMSNTQPLAAEIEELSRLVRQLAESVSRHELASRAARSGACRGDP